ncbi:Uncharacterized protein SCF082_LOCUS4259, partial [Durusdinium trenchii]
RPRSFAMPTAEPLARQRCCAPAFARSRCRSASYTFPKPDTKMNAKIDVYQHVGSGSVVIDPKFFTTDEVSIRCHDVLMQNIRLQVTSQVAQASAEEQCQRRQAAQEENKESALTYLTVHGIEQTR